MRPEPRGAEPPVTTMRIAIAGCRGVPALYSGFETAATEIGARLVERGHDVSVYCRRGYGDESELTHRGIRKIYLPQLNLKTAETLSHTLVSLAHAFVRPPDVLLVMNPANGPLLALPRLRGTPVAINVDGLEWRRSKWSALGRRYLRWAAWVSTKMACAVIVDSHELQRMYRMMWNTESFYASYGADIETSTSSDLIASYGLEPDEYFLVVARLEPENNTDLIVRAFAETRTDKKLVVVGGNVYDSAYVRALRASTHDGRVVFVGPVYEQRRLTELMCHAFVYVHGHMVGGTNPVLLKALGCGARVLVADVAFNLEVVADAGLSFPLDPDGARAVFQSLVDDRRHADRCRARARDRIREAYTWDIATDGYEELCRRLVSSPPLKRPGDA